MTKCFDYMECGDPARCGSEGVCRNHEAEKRAAPQPLEAAPLAEPVAQRDRFANSKIVAHARNIQHSQWHDGPGDVCIAVQKLLDEVSAQLDECGYSGKLERSDPQPTQQAPGDALRPCPFCNSIVLVVGGFHVHCVRCGTEGPDSDTPDEADIIAAWNRRAILAAPAVAREPLMEEQIRRLCLHSDSGTWNGPWRDFARAIEGAHGIGDGKHASGKGEQR